MRRLAILLALATSFFIIVPALPHLITPANASVSETSVIQVDGQALNWAETQTGKPYIYGDTGPGGYDCSGLVYEAYKHVGITLPRTTYSMLSSPHLRAIPESEAHRGDLAFYGSGHVELLTSWYHMTFGAHSTGSPVSWIKWSSYWEPTAFYEVIG